MKKGRLYLIPTPISSKYNMQDILLPMYSDIVSNLTCFIVETPKLARINLKSLHLKTSIQDLRIEEFSEH